MKSNAIFKFALLRSLSKSRSKNPHNQQGFTLIEVIVAVVVSSIFILAAMTALVIGLNGKLKAKLNNEATLIIERDLESVRYASTQMGVVNAAPTTINGLPTTAAPATSISVTFISPNKSVDLVIPVTLALVRTASGTVGTNYLSTATVGAELKIDLENTAYTLKSPLPSIGTSTPVTVTMDTSKINVKATTLKTDLAAITASSPTTIITETDATSRIKVGDRIIIGPSSVGNSLFSVIVTAITTTTISFVSPSSTVAYPAGTPITVLPRSGDTIVNKSICTAAIASKFMEFIPPLDKSSITFDGREYRLTRRRTDLNPIVQLDYEVFSVTGTTVSSTPLAELTTQVIPNVASQCP
jgi:prepilin-type N-terminal cleavage/methylation domain-containing protein